MSKSKNKKTPPTRQPATLQNVKSAYLKGIDQGIQGAYAIVFLVLRDHFGFDNDMLLQVHQHVLTWSDEINRRPQHLAEIIKTLQDEYGIDLNN